jgi:hypothetical protein
LADLKAFAAPSKNQSSGAAYAKSRAIREFDAQIDLHRSFIEINGVLVVEKAYKICTSGRLFSSPMKYVISSLVSLMERILEDYNACSIHSLLYSLVSN